MSLHHQAQAIAPKVRYEFNMLQYCFKRIRDERKNADIWLRNLLLEDFLLHARVLRDFFVGTPRQDDVSANHFFDDPSPWPAIFPSLCPYLTQHKARLGKYLAHLTYSRINEDKNWVPETIYNELNSSWQQFIAQLPPVRQGWFQ